MNLHQLECFVSAATYHSFSLAARKLYLSQPNLSKAVEQLEDELGIILFTRSNKGVTLTKDGEGLLRQALSILDQVKTINEFYNQRKQIVNEFKVSSLPIFPVYNMLCSLQNQGIIIKFHETHRSQVINDIIDHRSEIGVIMISSLNPIRFKDIFLKIMLDLKLSRNLKHRFIIVSVIH